MKILSIHNFPGNYATGGEGNVFEDESQLLRQYNHQVRQYKCTNAEIVEGGAFKRVEAFLSAPWSTYGYQVIREEIEKFKPDIMHVHNFFFVLSPSIFRAAKETGVPTVATLHNFRYISPCSQLLRDGRVCELCLNKNPWRILVYRCYKKRFMANLLRYRIYYSGKKKYRWLDDIDSFISLSEFGKYKYIHGGIPENKIFVKPNFLFNTVTSNDLNPKCKGAVFVGRLSPEKGVKTLLKAWRGLDYPLAIIGDGPQMAELRGSAPPSVQFLGMKSHDFVLQAIKDSAFLVFPSEWYETFGLTMIESMAMGRAVLASDLGPRKEIVQDGKTGLLFRVGDSVDLHAKAKWLINNPKECSEMGKAGREAYLNKFTEEVNYKMLLNIYNETINRRKLNI